MTQTDDLEIDPSSPPFKRLRRIRRLGSDRGGHGADDSPRHRLFVARDPRTRTDVLIKVTSRPGLIYERDLVNETASLSTINRELPHSRYFPWLGEHGRLPDGRVYLTMSMFDEFPVATTIAWERVAAKQVDHLKEMVAITLAVAELHTLEIWHVDLNPMNILCRWESGRPVVRIVDFESSYEVARHSRGVFYNPPTTPGYVAPEVAHAVPDARADVFSLGAVLYTMLAGYGWTWTGAVDRCVDGDPHLGGEIGKVLRTAVAADPARRFRSVADLHDAVAGCLARDDA